MKLIENKDFSKSDDTFGSGFRKGAGLALGTLAVNVLVNIISRIIRDKMIKKFGPSDDEPKLKQ
jgi:hypothetical protein